MKKYVLYAEDDHDDFDLMGKAFREVNPKIELINVTSGYEVIRFLQHRNNSSYPFLILMDIKMPLLNGMETIDLLKVNEKFSNIPIVLFSTSTSAKEEKQISEAGMELIKKPSFYEEWVAIAKDLGKYCSAMALLAMVS